MPELDLVQFITTVGYIGVFAIVFAESGLFFGFFLPGDSLLLTAGLLASRGVLNEAVLVPGIFVAAVLGDSVGYWFGNKTGPHIFNRPSSLLFRRENLLKARAFYEKHGGKTITLARFMPFIRTFVPIVAGAVSMNYRRFLLFNFIGAFFWGVGVTMLGFGLGRAFGSIEGVDKYFTLLVLAFFLIPGLPALVHLWRDSREDVLRELRKLYMRVMRKEAA